MASPGRTLTDPPAGGGYVYVVTNPAWPGFVKIGSCVDPHVRVRQFNTASPFRDFKLEGYRRFPDRKLAESRAHNMLRDRQAQGEWFRVGVAEALSCVNSVPLDEQ